MWFTEGRPLWENGQSLLCEEEMNIRWSILLTTVCIFRVSRGSWA